MAILRSRRFLWIMGAAGVASAAVVAAVVLLAEPPPARAGSGAVTGKVTYAGPVTPEAYVVEKNKEVCGVKPIPYEIVMVDGSKGLKNAVVSIGAPKPATLPAKDAALDQVGCVFVPHVGAMTKNAYVNITSSDPVLHNVHAYLGDRTIFNVGLPVKGMKVKKKMKKSGHLSMKCDAGHTWMNAHIQIFDHPYFAVTAADGTFSITGVPAGSHTATVWHEKLGEKTATVTVGADGAGTLSVAF